MKDYERLCEIKKTYENTINWIRKCEEKLNFKRDNEDSDDDELECHPLEAEAVVKNLEDFGNIAADNKVNVDEMMKNLNNTQKRIFHKV